MSRDKLFDKLFDLDEHQKARILSYIFGLMETKEAKEEAFEPSEFFQIIENRVKEFKE